VDRDDDMPEASVAAMLDDEQLAEGESDEAELAEAELVHETLAHETLADQELAGAEEPLVDDGLAEEADQDDAADDTDETDGTPAEPVAEPAATSGAPLVAVSGETAVEVADDHAAAAPNAGADPAQVPVDEAVMAAAAGVVLAGSPVDAEAPPGDDEERRTPSLAEPLAVAPADTPEIAIEPLAVPDAARDAFDGSAREDGTADQPAILPQGVAHPPEVAVRAAPPRRAAAPRNPVPAEPGQRPLALPGPRNGVPDNLQRIRGIGQKNEELLNALGIYHFGQIAAWTPAEARWIANQLAFPERLERDDWVGQAIVFATGGDTGYVKAPARRGKDEDDSPVAA
jgi:predicted flap endonuclease-1-like 5' DNA nuclease